MHLVVCIKQVLDPEQPPSEFRLDPSGQKAAPGSAGQVISIFDENAIEVALQVREKEGQGKITAISLGGPAAIDGLRKALSLRVDESILIREEDFPALDTWGTARVLAAAIRRLEPPVDLVLCGRESADWHGGTVAAFLAAELGYPYAAFVAGVACVNNKFQFRRQSDDGWETIEMSRPAIISVTNDDQNLPRLPKVKDNMMAFRKQIPVWTAQSLGVNPAEVCGPNAALESVKLYIPVTDRSCEMISGDTVQEKAAQFVRRLVEIGVI